MLGAMSTMSPLEFVAAGTTISLILGFMVALDSNSHLSRTLRQQLRNLGWLIAGTPQLIAAGAVVAWVAIASNFIPRVEAYRLVRAYKPRHLMHYAVD